MQLEHEADTILINLDIISEKTGKNKSKIEQRTLNLLNAIQLARQYNGEVSIG